MNLQQRIGLLEKLGKYILSDSVNWEQVKERAYQHNKWFVPEFISLALKNIAEEFLQKNKLVQLASQYRIPENNPAPKNIGIVMAGNIPLVGFHDFLCVFITGNKQSIKPSSKDDLLLRHLTDQLIEWDSEVSTLVRFSEMLKGCDAYIATGSNNSARYFEQYFGKYPHVIRRNRTSVAILTGDESRKDLEKLADDVHQFFGLGCRNVTKIYVPKGYDFIPLLDAFKKYDWMADQTKYKNNYDYQLAVMILNKEYYMSNESIHLQEKKSVFSPISQLNYEFYEDINSLERRLEIQEDIQCVVGKGHLPFGEGQKPGLTDFADGVDMLKFLLELKPNLKAG